MLDNNKNWFLNSLTPDERRWLEPLEPVAFVPNIPLVSPPEPPDFIWFVDRGFISVQLPLLDGRAIEVATVGRRGVFPMLAAYSDGPTDLAFIPLIPGVGVRAPAAKVRAARKRHPKLDALFIRGSRASILVLAQTQACALRHSVEQRIVRRFLAMTWDTRRIEITQDELVHHLGLKSRTAVSKVYDDLTALGLIRYRYGEVEILDRRALCSHACECFDLMEKTRPGSGDDSF